MLERGREAFERRAWSEALSSLTAADRQQPLELDDLEMLAYAAHLRGQDDDAIATGVRAYRVAVEAGEIERAAKAGFWVGMAFGEREDFTQAEAWFGRARRVLEESGRDSVETGYLMIPIGLRRLAEGDAAVAFETFQQVAAYAARFRDPDLTTLGRLGRGQSLIATGDRDRGLALLDEAMLSVTSGEASAVVAGIVYCAVIEACHRVLDMRRAHEWTTALTQWCAAQPDLVPYRGQCLVYRAELMRFHGDWAMADAEARRARTLLLGPPVAPAVGEALYQLAELHRLRGESGEAERAYHEGSEYGRRPEPGLALLRLATGRADAAWAMIRRALGEAPEDPRLLEAAVEIALGRDDRTQARAHADRLHSLTGPSAPVLLRAMAARASGTVLLSEDLPTEALRALRESWALWQQLDAPYDAAGVRVQIARACRAAGDDETAELELDSARRVFGELGAAPALAKLASRGHERAAMHGLSPRELEVLGHLAEGRTNREIADRLGISERTVDRHVSNIYAKIGVSSRAMATAWSYEHDLT